MEFYFWNRIPDPVGYGYTILPRGFREDHGKLFSPVTGGYIITSKLFLDCICNGRKYKVPLNMAEGVIYLFEIIDIHQHKAEFNSLPNRPVKLHFQRVHHVTTIVETGQVVGNR